MNNLNHLTTCRRWFTTLTAGLSAAILLCGFPLKADVNACGSDSTMHVLKALAAAYEADSGKKVSLQGGGSGAGAKALEAGEVTLAFLSRGLNDAEIAAGLVGKQYAVDGVAVIVNKANPTTDLSVAALKDLFTGKTSTWSDGKPVVPFNRNTDSGTREVFQEKVLGKDGFAATAAIKHDGVLVSTVSKIPTAVAYSSLAEADEAQIKIVTVNGVKPSAATLKDKTYSISRTPTLATKGEASGEEKAFIDFVLSAKGQAIVAHEGLVPLL
jgi:phosphate transport system substrate-binding protein